MGRTGTAGLLALALAGALVGPAGAAFDVEAAKRSTVRLDIYIASKRCGLGSGIVVAPGVVATNRHVIECEVGDGQDKRKRRADRVVVVHRDDRAEGRIMAVHGSLDLALIEVPGLGLPATALNSMEPAQGDAVNVLGFPGLATQIADDEGQRVPSLTAGIVSKMLTLNPQLGGGRFVQHTAPIAGGNSGGPLLNVCTQVIGVNTFTFKIMPGMEAQNAHFSLHIGGLRDFLRQQGVAFRDTAGPCVPGQVAVVPPPAVTPAPAIAPPPAPVAPPPSPPQAELGTSVKTVAAGAVAAVLLALAGFLAFRYRRTDGTTTAPAPAPSAQEKTVVAPLAPKSARWRLEGSDGAGRPVALDFTEDRVRGNAAGLVLGRDSSEADLAVADATVSRRHANLVHDGEDLCIIDLGSTNGTTVDGRALSPRQRVPVLDGSTILLGRVKLVVRRSGAA